VASTVSVIDVVEDAPRRHVAEDRCMIGATGSGEEDALPVPRQCLG
jgi:hypothetical protein